MDVVRGAARQETISKSKRAGRELNTGPMPSVPWRDLNRRSGLEPYLPTLLLLAFGLLAMIQLLLRG